MGKPLRVRVNARLPNPDAATYADIPFHNDSIDSVSFAEATEGTGSSISQEQRVARDRSTVGVLWDVCTDEVSSALVRDVLMLSGRLGSPLTLYLPEGNDDATSRIDVLSRTSGVAPITVIIDANIRKQDVDLWLRYWVKEKPYVPFSEGTKVVDRDIQRVKGPRGDATSNLSDAVVIPTGPYVPRGRGVQPTSNPLIHPPANPLLQPTINYASTKGKKR